MKKGRIIPVLLIALSLIVSCAGKEEAQTAKGEITVGSKIDTEGALLGSMIAIMLEKEGFEVVDKIQTGSTPIVREAIIAGEIDIYPEYTGNGYYFFSGETEAGIWKDFRGGWEAVKKLDMDANSIVWLEPAPANNTWAIAMRRDDAREAGIVSLEDLAGYLNGGGEFKLAGSEEFVSSDAALPAFEEGYGFTVDDRQLLVLSGGNTTLTEKAAATRQDGVNAAMAYGTDGQLAALDLVVLEDTRNIQPVYAPAPIIRSEVLEKHPEIEQILKPVFASLELETLQDLNGKIAVDGADPRATAEAYLKENGFLE